MHRELICPTFSILMLPLASCAARNLKQCKQSEASCTNNLLGEMITIPADSFLMGNKRYEGLEEIPLSTLFTFQPINIGKYEVTRSQYRKFIKAGVYKVPNYWSDISQECREATLFNNAFSCKFSYMRIDIRYHSLL